MRQSALFAKTQKQLPKDETSTNARLLLRAGFVHKEMAGVYSFLPLGLRVLNNIANIIREEMFAIGGQEVFLPSLNPKQNWQQTGRWETLDDLFRFTSLYTKTDYALAGTHEEIIVPLVQRFVSSYKELPVAIFQIQNKFRDEKRAKSGLLRGREFLMKDLYSFHANEQDLDRYYQVVKESYDRIFKKAGVEAVYTFASGGTFSKYSHEFQVLTQAGEDTVHVCGACALAVNEEILREQPGCPQCGNKNLRREKAIEVGNIFKLKTKYSSAFQLTYKDERGENKEVIMGCYGIGLNRLMGTIVETSHDKRGIIWPESVAPFLVHLLQISDRPKEAEAAYEQLQNAGIEGLYDDREEVRAGEKCAEADLLGIPWRVVISDKALAQENVEVKERKSERVELVKLQNITDFLRATNS